MLIQGVEINQGDLIYIEYVSTKWQFNGYAVGWVKLTGWFPKWLGFDFQLHRTIPKKRTMAGGLILKSKYVVKIRKVEAKKC